MTKRFQNQRATGLLIAAAFLAALELVGHIAYRARHDHFLWNQPVTALFDPYALERHAPGVAAKDASFGLGTDRYGFVHNGYERDLAAREGKFLVVLLGGSTVEGLGVKNDETVAAQLERILNARKPDAFWVVNAGYHGYVSYQEQGLLAGRVSALLKPDLVLALDGRNDAAMAASYRAWRPNWQPYFDVVELGVNGMRNPFPWAGTAAWLLRHSSIAKLESALLYRLTGRAPGAPAEPDLDVPADDSVVGRAVASYFANHAAAAARCRETGCAYAAFLQPTLIDSLRRDMTAFERKELEEFEKRTYRREGIYRPGMERFYAKASSAARGRARFHDLSRLFVTSEGEPYVDSCHYSKEGGRLIAEKIAAALVQDRLLPSQRAMPAATRSPARPSP